METGRPFLPASIIYESSASCKTEIGQIFPQGGGNLPQNGHRLHFFALPCLDKRWGRVEAFTVTRFFNAPISFPAISISSLSGYKSSPCGFCEISSNPNEASVLRSMADVDQA